MRLKRAGAPIIILCLLLSACGGGELGDRSEQLALDIRGDYLAMTACTATAEMTADYGQRVYEYSMEISWQREGETVLSITAPENIAGIQARIQNGETALEYDGVRLETGPLNEQGLSPVDALPVLLAAAREGFIAECGMETLNDAGTLRICCRDPESQAGSGQEITLWFEPDTGALLRGELAVDGFTVIQCVFTSFSMELPAEGTA